RINQANLVQIPTYLYWVQYNELIQIKNNEPLKQSDLDWQDYKQ
ncbi:13079_t:CDS:1, partial [Cetraspora pellucida]